jgi:Spx/MgsR family transcriptional regulator
MLRLYGISNCDTVKRARAWLSAAGLEHQFVDFKREAPSVALLKQWAGQQPWETLLNRAGTTWRKLDAAEQALAVDEAGALALMATHASLIKRPVVDWGDGRLSVGFKEPQFALLAKERS